MAEGNVDAVRAVYERFGKGDFSASLEIVDPLSCSSSRRGFPSPGPIWDAQLLDTRGSSSSPGAG